MSNKLLVVTLVSALATPVWAAKLNDNLDAFGEIALIYGKRDSDSATVDGFAVKTVNLGAVYKPHETFDATVSALHEEDLDEVVTDPEIDQAFVTWHALPDAKLDVSLGKQYLPFGKFETTMVHDPLTLELGEGWREQTLVVSSKRAHWTTHGFAFAPEATKPDGSKHNSGYGVGINYATENAGIGAEYVSNLTEMGGFAEVNHAAKAIPGIVIHGNLKLGRVTLLGEHVAATKAFQAGDLASAENSLEGAAKPRATHLEADLDLNHDRILAMAWNQTQDAGAQLELPKQAYGVTYSQPLAKSLTAALEVLEAKDYAEQKAQSLTAQLAWGF